MLKASLLMFNIFLFLLYMFYEQTSWSKNKFYYFSKYKKCFTEIIF